MAISLDDSQLLRLAADPRTRLFADPGRAAVLAPLVLVASLLPALAIVLGPELDDRSASWALRALDTTTTRDIQGWLQPGRDGFGRSLIYQPPLAAWLLALVMRAFGPDRPVSWHLVSCLATCGFVGIAYRLARRLGGASFALMAMICICCHPLTLRLIMGMGPAPLGLLLLLVAVWGFVGHLGGPPTLVSFRLLIGSLAWGLSLLAVGPVALALLPPLLFHVGLLRRGVDRAASGSPAGDLIRNIWPGLRAALLFAATGLSFSTWWEVMMLSEHGGAFWHSWWTGQPVTDASLAPAEVFSWLRQNSFLCAWLVIGLAHTVRELWRPSTELSRRRCQFVLLWWSMALAVRLLLDVVGLRMSVSLEAWDGFLLIPSALIAAGGLGAVVRRETSPIFEVLALSATAGLGVWRMTNRSMFGVIAFAASLVILAMLPGLTSRWRLQPRSWSERDWRRVLQGAIVLILAGHIAMGLIERPRSSADDLALAELRQRLRAIPTVRGITLVSVNGSAPASLQFLLLSRWPTARFTVAEAWNTDATGRAARASKGDTAEELVVEWSRRDLRLITESTSDWQAIPLGEPLRYGDRRLIVYAIEPRRK